MTWSHDSVLGEWSDAEVVAYRDRQVAAVARFGPDWVVGPGLVRMLDAELSKRSGRRGGSGSADAARTPSAAP